MKWAWERRAERAASLKQKAQLSFAVRKDERKLKTSFEVPRGGGDRERRRQEQKRKKLQARLSSTKSMLEKYESDGAVAFRLLFRHRLHRYYRLLHLSIPASSPRSFSLHWLTCWTQRAVPASGAPTRAGANRTFHQRRSRSDSVSAAEASETTPPRSAPAPTAPPTPRRSPSAMHPASRRPLPLPPAPPPRRRCHRARRWDRSPADESQRSDHRHHRPPSRHSSRSCPRSSSSSQRRGRPPSLPPRRTRRRRWQR